MFPHPDPANIYLLKVNNKSSNKRCEKKFTPFSNVFIVEFEDAFACRRMNTTVKEETSVNLRIQLEHVKKQKLKNFVFRTLS